jgi:DNA replication and repair protein RecF
MDHVGGRMQLKSLDIRNIRKIKQSTLTSTRDINLVYGANGSGKTSTLEAIYLLGTGRSFRSVRPADVISWGQDRLVVRGQLETSGGRIIDLGIEKDLNQTQIRINQDRVYQASRLAEIVPVLVMTADSQGLLHDGPGKRRAFIDRTLFHVEQRYLKYWKEYQRALRQRNALLRANASLDDGRYWNAEIARHAEFIDIARHACVQSLNETLQKSVVSQVLGPVGLQYRRGWGEGELSEKLDKTWSRDAVTGLTTIGAHRADIAITVNGAPAAPSISRGQASLVVAAIISEQAALIEKRSGKRALLLIDDLPSDLDVILRETAVSLLLAPRAQTFFTAVNAGSVPELEQHAAQLFHVEHGRITPAVPRVA